MLLKLQFIDSLLKPLPQGTEPGRPTAAMGPGKQTAQFAWHWAWRLGRPASMQTAL